MNLPVEVQKLCEQYLEKIKQDPLHTLTDSERFDLYLKFGASKLLQKTESISLSNYTRADLALCWLALLTAKKVAFICQRGPADFEETEADEVEKILRTAEGYLNREVTFEEAGQVLDDCWYFFRPHLNYDVLCAWRASMEALTFILYGTTSRQIIPGFDEFVIDAVDACTVIDHNLPGEADSPEPPIPLEYDMSKRLRFWQWWLTEAVPLAWASVRDSQ